jgi:hypothetical protein
MAAVVAVAPPVQAIAVFQYFIPRGTANIIQPDGSLNNCIINNLSRLKYSNLIINAYHILDQILSYRWHQSSRPFHTQHWHRRRRSSRHTLCPIGCCRAPPLVRESWLHCYMGKLVWWSSWKVSLREEERSNTVCTSYLTIINLICMLYLNFTPLYLYNAIVKRLKHNNIMA